MESYASIQERIRHIADYFYNGNISAMAKSTFISRTTLNSIIGEKEVNPGYDTIRRIAETPGLNISLDWLITGKGEMLKSVEPQKIDNQLLGASEKITYLEKITSLQDKISNLQDRINNMYEVIIALTAAKGESPDEDTETNRIYSKEIEDFFKEVEERTAKRESRSSGRNAG